MNGTENARSATIHRYHKDHVPNCLKPLLNDKIKAIASIAEMDIVEKEKTPPEFRDYVKEKDNKVKDKATKPTRKV